MEYYETGTVDLFHEFHVMLLEPWVSILGKKEEQKQLPIWKISKSAVAIDDSLVHLGLQWFGNTGRVDVQHNIQKARHMAYMHS